MESDIRRLPQSHFEHPDPISAMKSKLSTSGKIQTKMLSYKAAIMHHKGKYVRYIQ